MHAHSRYTPSRRYGAAITRRAGAALILLVASVSLVAAEGPRALPHAGATAARSSLTFDARFEGVGAEGTDMIWRGALTRGAPGEVTTRLYYVGPETMRAERVRPVEAFVFVSTDDPMLSFAAELRGSVDWRSGRATLRGVITDGWRRGEPVEESLLLDPHGFDGHGTLRMTRAAVALRAER